MFGEFKEVVEIKETKGNLWTKCEKEALTEAQIMQIVKDNYKREDILENDEIKKAIWAANNEEEIAEIRAKIWNEFDFKMSIFNYDSKGNRTFREEDIVHNEYTRKMSFIDHQGEVYRMYLLLKKLNSKQDIKTYLDEIVNCYKMLTCEHYNK